MRTIQATFQDGVFRPLEPVALPQGAKVEITIPTVEGRTPHAGRYASVTGLLPVEVLDRMESDIEEAFGRVDADAWK